MHKAALLGQSCMWLKVSWLSPWWITSFNGKFLSVAAGIIAEIGRLTHINALTIIIYAVFSVENCVETLVPKRLRLWSSPVCNYTRSGPKNATEYGPVFHFDECV